MQKQRLSPMLKKVKSKFQVGLRTIWFPISDSNVRGGGTISTSMADCQISILYNQRFVAGGSR